MHLICTKLYNVYKNVKSGNPLAQPTSTLLKHVLLIGGGPCLPGIGSQVSTITVKYFKEHRACEDGEKPTCCGEHKTRPGNGFDIQYATLPERGSRSFIILLCPSRNCCFLCRPEISAEDRLGSLPPVESVNPTECCELLDVQLIKFCADNQHSFNIQHNKLNHSWNKNE